MSLNDNIKKRQEKRDIYKNGRKDVLLKLEDLKKKNLVRSDQHCLPLSLSSRINTILTGKWKQVRVNK